MHNSTRGAKPYSSLQRWIRLSRRDAFGWNVLWTVIYSLHIHIWIIHSWNGRYLIGFPKVFNDTEVVLGSFHKAVLKQPSIWVRLWIAQEKDIPHCCLEVTDPSKYRYLEKETEGGGGGKTWFVSTTNPWFVFANNELMSWTPVTK